MTSCSKKVTLSVVAATLFVGTARAQAPQKTVIKNNTVSTSGQIDTGTYVLYHAGVNNGNDPDGKPAVYIVVDLCSHIPDQAHRYCVYAQGYAPLSTLTWKDAELVKVDVPDISTLQYGGGGVTDCTSGFCMGGPVPSLAFRATWTRYRGPSSSESEMHGISRFTIRSDTGTVTERRVGLDRNYSAALQLSLGNVQLVIPGGSQARITRAQNVSVEIERTIP